MKLCSIWVEGRCEAAVQYGDRIVTLLEINRYVGSHLPVQLIEIIRNQEALKQIAESKDRMSAHAGRTMSEVRFSAPFYDPPMIWGIGLNYRDHANDLGVQLPSEPASFMKPRTTIIGNGDSIILPSDSDRVTAEAELGIVLGRRCKNVRKMELDQYVFGYVPVLDMTAEDILQRNPRFLTRAKSYDTFFSFGPFILTPDEIESLPKLTVSTVLNGQVARSNQVRNMTFSPSELVEFHSRIMTLEPGDIISTGTPGAVIIKDQDLVECRIDGFPVLRNNVRSSLRQ
jgi:2-keto-4-pentenoate hydratase/2-oxohepta-3-ene-1,7-dioic acid hydratase in catechol pathway